MKFYETKYGMLPKVKALTFEEKILKYFECLYGEDLKAVPRKDLLKTARAQAEFYKKETNDILKIIGLKK